MLLLVICLLLLPYALHLLNKMVIFCGFPIYSGRGTQPNKLQVRLRGVGVEVGPPLIKWGTVGKAPSLVDLCLFGYSHLKLHVPMDRMRLGWGTWELD